MVKLFKLVKRVSAFLSPLVGVSAITYGASCWYFEKKAAELQDPETDKLAILISAPHQFYDPLRYFPGATELYVHRVETAFGKRARVFDPATKEDIINVLIDERISDIVVAGHGDWRSWTQDGAELIEYNGVPQGFSDEQKTQLRKAKKKTGLFVRHTCGKGRGLARRTEVDEDIQKRYEFDLNRATEGKIVDFRFSRYSEKTQVYVREGETLTREERQRVESLILQFYNEAVYEAPVYAHASTQFGSHVVEHEEQVRGWDYVTSPITFLWNPIPEHLPSDELYRRYLEIERPEMLEEIVGNVAYDIKQTTEHLETYTKGEAYDAAAEMTAIETHRALESEQGECLTYYTPHEKELLYMQALLDEKKEERERREWSNLRREEPVNNIKMPETPTIVEAWYEQEMNRQSEQVQREECLPITPTASGEFPIYGDIEPVHTKYIVRMGSYYSVLNLSPLLSTQINQIKKQNI
ncbi:hypothetical protein HZC31_05265 [Candidatus Woesearchaeota archaeon]|nr:hypothetical protein [Candidatus Woesearchaeota archaeon]